MVVIMDLTDLGWSNINIEETKLVLDGLQHRLPIRLAALYVHVCTSVSMSVRMHVCVATHSGLRLQRSVA